MTVKVICSVFATMKNIVVFRKMQSNVAHKTFIGLFW